VMALGEKRIDKVGSEKTRGASDQNSLLHSRVDGLTRSKCCTTRVANRNEVQVNRIKLL
jgi:hypothetical protein